MPAGGTPVFEKPVELVAPARRGVGAAEQSIGRFIVFTGEERIELLDPSFLSEIMKHESKDAANHGQTHQRDHHRLDDLRAPLVSGAILIQKTGHSHFDYGSLCRGRSR